MADRFAVGPHARPALPLLTKSRLHTSIVKATCHVLGHVPGWSLNALPLPWVALGPFAAVTGLEQERATQEGFSLSPVEGCGLKGGTVFVRLEDRERTERDWQGGGRQMSSS